MIFHAYVNSVHIQELTMPSGEFSCERHPSSRPIRIAVIGTGEWSRRFHLPALKVLADEVPDAGDFDLRFDLSDGGHLLRCTFS
jgi:hypothetical protein